MVLEERVAKVPTDGFPTRLGPLRREVGGHEVKVLLKMCRVPRNLYELDESVAGIVIEPRRVCKGNDAVLIRGQASVPSNIKRRSAAAGVNQPGLVKTIAPHHAA